MSEVRIPPTLDRRPKWKGKYPIPYVMFIDAQGVPDFRVNDEAKQAKTINERLCALCGAKLPPNWVALIGGPACAESHLFIDGPMHEGCARYAFVICPYLATPGAHHAATEAIQQRHADRVLAVAERAGAQRPDRMGLVFARDWRMVRLQGAPQLYFHVPTFERVEWRP